MTRRGVYAAALVVAAAADVVQHRPAVPTYCHAGRRCRGGRGQDKRCWADKTCAAKADNRRCPAPASPHSVVVLTRVLFEQPFLAGFVDWCPCCGCATPTAPASRKNVPWS